MVFTESGELFREITTQLGDTFIQYEFNGDLGEKFSTQLVLGDDRVSENFVI